MKGKLEQAMSKARFTPGSFFVQYRDFGKVIQLPVDEFWKIAEVIPKRRIARIWGETYGSDVVMFYESRDLNLLAIPVTIRSSVDETTLAFVENRHLNKDSLYTPQSG